MNNKIDLLERFYNSFINEESPKSFFGGLSDYIYFIDENPEIDSVVKKLFSEKKLFENKLKRLEAISLKKISEIHKEFLSYINKNKIEDGLIKNALQEYDNWLNGRFFGSSTLVEELHDSLCDIVRRLYKLPEHKDFAKNHIIFWGDKINIKNYLYLKEVDDYFETLRDLKEKYEDKLWGKILEIIHLCKVVEFGKDKHRELVKQMKGENSSKTTFEILNHDVLLAEWQAIDKGGHMETNAIFFDVNKVKPIITRFQNYLIKELNKDPEKTKTQNQAKVKYKNGILYVGNKEIDFNKKTNQKELLDTLFQEPPKDWFYDEIQGMWDINWDGFEKGNAKSEKYWQKFYTAGDGIKTAVAMETDIKDFIIKNTGTKGKIRINPKYI